MVFLGGLVGAMIGWLICQLAFLKYVKIMRLRVDLYKIQMEQLTIVAELQRRRIDALRERD